MIRRGGINLIKIVLCEDDQSQLHQYKKILKNIEDRSEGVFRLESSTSNPHDVVDYSKHCGGEHLYIIDIHLNDPDLDGIKLAKILRKQNRNDEIILLTSDGEKIPDTFKNNLKILDYIMKGDLSEIESRLWKALQSLSEEKELLHFTCKKQGRELEFDLSDILFVCTTPISGKVEIATINGDHAFYNSLKEIEAKIPELFRISQSYLVNLKNAQRYDDGIRKLIMIDGQKCDVSFSNRRKVRKLMK